MSSASSTVARDVPRRDPVRRAGHASRRGQGIAGWLFVSPALAILLLFLAVPIVLALYISFTDYSGVTNPLSSQVHLVGLANYRTLITTPGLAQQDFGTAIRNNFYFVLFTVPLQTALALYLAVLLNDKHLRANGAYRTAFYFPSITSSIAITTVFIFLFSGTGAVNDILSYLGIRGPNWLFDSRGIFTVLLGHLGVNGTPGWASHQILGLSIWGWLSGPSFGMCVIILLCTWTTAGTFMLLFLAGLQGVGGEVLEASSIDGATPWQRFRLVTFPILRPTVVLVVTLGLISTWQVFDQIFLTGPHNPSIVTPAYLSYEVSFLNSAFGEGAAIAFLLFALIVTLTFLQRRFVKEDLTK